MITKVSFLQLVRGAHPTSEPRRDLQSGDYLISQCEGEPFLLVPVDNPEWDFDLMMTDECCPGSPP